ncbi:MAG TPA: alpha-glucan family phosphorylase [Actinomycetota bacterium]|nr:alpha-glucan family phosphorylase [Actinomycetota bacterium]
MRALRSFLVRARLPEPLLPLHEIAMNLWWSWDGRCRELFRRVDPAGWEEAGHNPVSLLYQLSRGRMDELASDADFLAHMHWMRQEMQRYLSEPRWFQSKGTDLRRVAYFSPEFGISEALPQYSGGLGVLAGDHLKAASDLGVPLVAVGLLYRHGYFRQDLDVDGWQREDYPTLDPEAMALVAVDDVAVEVDLAGVPLHARVWRGEVGRVQLYLLDANVASNDEAGRQVTDRLYGGGQEHRLRQEILLGIGGVRALAGIGAEPQIFHTNEGHAGFLALELIRDQLAAGLTLAEAVQATRAQTIFTTHTPVPAGIDRFPRDLMERYFSSWCESSGVPFDELMALGHAPDDPADAPFNMAMMSLRLAGLANGVAELHGNVSRRMFAPLWPGVPEDEVPITSVTNGVHARTWVSVEMAELLDRWVGPNWPEAGPEEWARIEECPDEELWAVRERGRRRLVEFVRSRIRTAGAPGAVEPEAYWADDTLDPYALTIGFARRFAGYKRATLLLSQPERLIRLLGDQHRPVQLIFAGKAHPADQWGKEMIQRIVAFSAEAGIRTRMTFIENYDMAVARELFAGADVWLNTPRRPQEACGTSGMKAALNGGLNCSILDGWWDEMFDPSAGWAIPSAEALPDETRRDAQEAESLFDLLERRVVPLFYEREWQAPPHRWVQRIKASLRILGPQVSAARMIRDYVDRIYVPAAVRCDALSHGSYERARALAAYIERVRQAWPQVSVGVCETDEALYELGTKREVRTQVHLGSLEPSDVEVQLLHGPVEGDGEMSRSSVEVMSVAAGGARAGGTYVYETTFPVQRAGRYGFTIRVVPSHPDLPSATSLGLVAWAGV